MADWPYSEAQWRALLKAIPPGTICTIRGRGCTLYAETWDHYPIEVWQLRLLRPRLDWLAFDSRNLRPACKRCNTRLGASLGGRRRAQVARARGGQRRQPPTQPQVAQQREAQSQVW